jgi:hypothetical protein
MPRCLPSATRLLSLLSLCSLFAAHCKPSTTSTSPDASPSAAAPSSAVSVASSAARDETADASAAAALPRHTGPQKAHA